MSSSTLTSRHVGDLSETTNSAWANGMGSDEFDYIPVSPWGPVALVLGIGSLTGLTNSVFGLGLAALAVVIGIVAFFKIRAGRGAVKGTGFAASGTILALLCLSLGSVKLVHAYQTECPEGFQRVNFPKEISDKQFVYYGGIRRLHPDVAPLIGQPVFLKGFMWQTQASEGLTEFVFLKDNGECCFGGEPKPYDMMVVRMADDRTTRAYTGMIAVAGILNANVHAGEGEPVYTVDATIVEEARTSF
ncbi:MAG: hypothetical protein RIK87_27635 [Fuerstiella sp.]